MSSQETFDWLVSGKPDDYGAARHEVVRTTQANAEEYYHAQELTEEEVAVLIKFFPRISYEEESKRTGEQRYDGTSTGK